MNAYHHSTMAVSEQNLLPEITRCLLCGNQTLLRRHRVEAQVQVWLLKCETCGVSSASRIPTDKSLSEFYQQFYTEASSPEAKVTLDRPERLVKLLEREMNPYLAAAQVRILDFGGGDGTLSLMLAEELLRNSRCQGVHVTVVDASGEVKKGELDPRISAENRLELDGGLDGSYDIVIASAVLEHLPRPVDTILKLIGAMKVGGVFYARTPYVEPLMRAVPISSIRRQLFPYPLHLHDMGQVFWKRLPKTLGLESKIEILHSRPSIVEGTLERHFLRALAAYALKAPWYIFGSKYGLVGGWEVFWRKIAK